MRRLIVPPLDEVFRYSIMYRNEVGSIELGIWCSKTGIVKEQKNCAFFPIDLLNRFGSPMREPPGRRLNRLTT